jgi:hypothetical protein
MRSAPRCRAIAIESHPTRLQYIADNATALGTPDLHIIAGKAPAGLQDLPTPDAVFIGGGLTTENLLATCWHALRAGGRLVANAVYRRKRTGALGKHSQQGNSPALPFNMPSQSANFGGGKRHQSHNGQSRNHSPEASVSSHLCSQRLPSGYASAAGGWLPAILHMPDQPRHSLLHIRDLFPYARRLESSPRVIDSRAAMILAYVALRYYSY